MSTTDDVKDLFGQLTNSYPAILGQPSDDDVKRLHESLTNLLQSIDIAGGTDSLSGLIDDDTDYQATYGIIFANDQRISSQSRELELKVTTRKPLYVYLDRVPFGAALTEPPPP